MRSPDLPNMTSSRDSVKVRSIVFTVNNYDNTENAILRDWGQVSYFCIGKEVGKTCGTPHLQGYVEFQQQVTLGAVKRKLPRSHMEPRRGNAEQASKYCKKDGDFEEFGEISRQGKRSEVDDLADAVVRGESIRQIAMENPSGYLRYNRGVIALKCALIVPRAEVPTVTVIIGPTGAGKSRAARELTTDAYIWTPACKCWFNGYVGQRDVIFEEFRGQIPFDIMLVILDRYECPLEYKGGMVEFCATNIVLTSPVRPDLWYDLKPLDGDIGQLMRRITEVKYISEAYTIPAASAAS